MAKVSGFMKSHPDITVLAGFVIIGASMYFNFKDSIPSYLMGLVSPTAGAPSKAAAKEEATQLKGGGAPATVTKEAAWGIGWREGRYGRDIDVPLKDLEYQGDTNAYKRLIVA